MINQFQHIKTYLLITIKPHRSVTLFLTPISFGVQKPPQHCLKKYNIFFLPVLSLTCPIFSIAKLRRKVKFLALGILFPTMHPSIKFHKDIRKHFIPPVRNCHRPMLAVITKTLLRVSTLHLVAVQFVPRPPYKRLQRAASVLSRHDNN